MKQAQVTMARQTLGQQHFLASGKTGLSFFWPPVLLISQASIRLVLQPWWAKSGRDYLPPAHIQSCSDLLWLRQQNF